MLYTTDAAVAVMTRKLAALKTARERIHQNTLGSPCMTTIT